MDLATRVRLIRNLSAQLGEREWDEITLVLDQLGLEPGSYYNDQDKAQYCQGHLAEATESDLIEMDNYLGGTGLAEASPSTESWKAGGLVRAFLSHLAWDKVFVSDVKDVLLGFGISGFVAHEDIAPSRAWIHEIESALRSCEVLVAFLRPAQTDAAGKPLRGFRDSDWCDQEVGWAAGRGVPMVPVRLGMDPYGFLGQYQGIQAFTMSAYGVAEAVFKTLIDRVDLRPRLEDALIVALGESPSWREANARSRRMREYVQDWTPARIELLEQAVKNTEVTGASSGSSTLRFLRSLQPADDGVPF